MIPVLLIVVAVWFAVSGLLVVAQIGKPRKPTTTQVAIGSLVQVGLIIWVLIAAALRIWSLS